MKTKTDIKGQINLTFEITLIFWNLLFCNCCYDSCCSTPTSEHLGEVGQRGVECWGGTFYGQIALYYRYIGIVLDKYILREYRFAERRHAWCRRAAPICKPSSKALLLTYGDRDRQHKVHLPFIVTDQA